MNVDSNGASFDDLPEELWTEIFAYLSAPQVLKCAQINKRAQKSSRHPLLWKGFFKRDFPPVIPFGHINPRKSRRVPSGPGVDWLSYYRRQYQDSRGFTTREVYKKAATSAVLIAGVILLFFLVLCVVKATLGVTVFSIHSNVLWLVFAVILSFGEALRRLQSFTASLPHRLRRIVDPSSRLRNSIDFTIGLLSISIMVTSIFEIFYTALFYMDTLELVQLGAYSVTLLVSVRAAYTGAPRLRSILMQISFGLSIIVSIFSLVHLYYIKIYKEEPLERSGLVERLLEEYNEDVLNLL